MTSSIPAALQKKLEAFLASPVESDSGYAPVSSKDEKDLMEIFYAIFHAKFEADCDGDLPVDVVLVNRNRHQAFHYTPLPRLKDNESEDLKALMGAVHFASLNFDIANRDQSLALRNLDYFMEGARDKKALQYGKTVFEPHVAGKDLTPLKEKIIAVTQELFEPVKAAIFKGEYQDFVKSQALNVEKAREACEKIGCHVEYYLNAGKATVAVTVHGLKNSPRFNVVLEPVVE